MTKHGLLEKQQRTVVPKWHTSRNAARSDEQLSSTNRRAPRVDHSADEERDYATAIEEFRATPGPWFAGDLLIDALSRRDRDIAEEVATAVMEAEDRASRPLLEVAKAFLDGRIEREPDDYPAGIKALRARLRRLPKNSVGWVDLAFHLNLVGKFKEAHRAIATALELSPDNRFVLRSASRFYLNRGEHDRAHDVLKSARATPHDPWLLAAEIAMATAVRRGSGFWRVGREMVKDGGFAPLHISELASAVGTAQLEAAAPLRQIRTMFTASLEDPTANSVAQAEWAYRNHDDVATRPDFANRTDVAEARAWEAFVEGNFDEALHFGEAWFADEPFSSRPANLVAWMLSSIYGNYADAIAVLNRAILPNPTNPILLNNLAFALANLNEVRKARVYVDRAAARAETQEDRLVVSATRGLIAFRERRYAEGSRLYAEVINRASAANNIDDRIPTIASLYLAREVVLAGLENASSVAEGALNLAKRSSNTQVRELAKRLEPTLRQQTPLRSEET